MSESTVFVAIKISADEYLKSYAGTARSVLATSEDGRRIRFPANILRPFVTREGIDGRFAIFFDDSRRFTRIEKL